MNCQELTKEYTRLAELLEKLNSEMLEDFDLKKLKAVKSRMEKHLVAIKSNQYYSLVMAVYKDRFTTYSIKDVVKHIHDWKIIKKQKNGFSVFFRNALDLEGSDIEYLPDNIKSHSSIILKNSKIKRLPKNLNVNKKLDLSYTGLKEIPKGTYFQDELHINNTKITKFPLRLSVDKLFIDKTQKHMIDKMGWDHDVKEIIVVD